jgi:lipid A 4'-phosphatase
MIEQRHLSLAVALAAIAAGVVFSLWPGFDLAVSRLFYIPGQGFPIDRLPLAIELRQAVWLLSDLMIAASAIGLVAALLGWTLSRISRRDWIFILSLYVIGPGLIVNVVLKNYWGRARPANVTAFGGERTFTPALWVADQCERNCSFVSGEGAASVAFAISAVFLLTRLRPTIGEVAFRLGTIAALGVGLLGPALRVMAGRHFLSDIIFAALIVFGVALALSRLMALGSRRT